MTFTERHSGFMRLLMKSRSGKRFDVFMPESEIWSLITEYIPKLVSLMNGDKKDIVTS